MKTKTVYGFEARTENMEWVEAPFGYPNTSYFDTRVVAESFLPRLAELLYTDEDSVRVVPIQIAGSL